MANSTSSASLLSKYQEYLDRAAGLNSTEDHAPLSLPPKFSVGIVGGGMSGLYSAILLQQHFPGVEVKIFDASDRVGGSVYTYRFSSEPNQYFEAGAMRIPCIDSHQPVFSLVEFLNKQFPEDPIELMDFKYLSLEGNRVFVNNTKQKNGCIMSAKYAAENYEELGFPEDALADGEANQLYLEALKPLSEAFETNFEEALMKYHNMSFREYLSRDLGWSSKKINYVEVMCCQSNDLRNGLLEQFFFDGIFDFQLTWKTIEGGMSKLPELCAEAVQRRNGVILLNSKVESLSQSNQRVKIGFSQPKTKDLIYEEFDAVIMAVPLPLLRLIPERPYFGTDAEQAMRATLFDPMSKFGLRFHSRFWERPDLNPPPLFGGQSTTDLPIRWVIYPDYGVGEKEKGVLHVYNWNSDSMQWRILSKEDKIKRALHDLQSLYPEVDIAQEYAGGEPGGEHFLSQAFEIDWWGMTYYLPGQFHEFYPAMVKPQGNIYFAGGHLASSLGWIVSGLESAKRAVSLLATKYGIKDVDYIR